MAGGRLQASAKGKNQSTILLIDTFTIRYEFLKIQFLF